ncbi:4-hydroxythreonine-4-phosphate dehydrogenase PdxA [Geosporobacter ferrireducens]|uniref:4-hydroxythreonine-4-phosphate dehydrogenase PdxA n=1 Tax=Geosporobacter ferrireducens TaxID=1424294 RepID=A0A1D8GFB2_9FIRM|nr:4-hydroxythreonine-4-phosphate dehydrogenase PdxA [Geosporobacter ferrireducens]AOT69585.1 4-hydroxythreonine-4-phosphate dehydrogenase PdxA [Geosporobacter ferrireducens]
MSQLPILGITMGDPNGIGPEITAKALANQHVYAICRPLVVGSAKIIKQAIGIIKKNLEVNVIASVEDAKFEYGIIDVLDQDNVDLSKLVYGEVSVQGGSAAYEAIAKVIELAMKDEIDATITGPLNKEALNLAGYHYSGHTEIYGALTGTKDYTMMLADGDLRVVHVSTHVSLREACDRCKKERVYKVIKLAHEVCCSLGIEKPRIAVAGLNPHAGENGLFGREEIEEISPAILQAQQEGICAEGPIAPDTLFSKARGGQYDIVVAMYHDQGHIPLKVVGFQYDYTTDKWKTISGVNITLGLPIIRSSVDHGTAFGKAGTGTANEESLLNAIEYGAKLAVTRIHQKQLELAASK